MPWHDTLRGFYPVIDRADAKLAEALLGAAGLVQVRLKDAPRADLADLARWARRVTRARGALLVVNDDLEVALEVEADCVHLGQDDTPLALARARIAAAGAVLRVGVSTHNLAQVEAAVAGGADYLGFGPVYPTRSKRDPDPVVGIEGLRAAVRAATPVPVVAIGGITPERAAEVAATGAAAACAISSVNQAPDPAAAARAIASAFGR